MRMRVVAPLVALLLPLVAVAAEPALSAVSLVPKHLPTGGRTRCALCHTAEGWDKVRAFPHDQTGFALRGAHAEQKCRTCHAEGFDRPIASACSACHTDVHGGNFGAQCAGCHEDTSWKPLFDADAHRRSNFPLVGAHALMPCQECHQDVAERTFAHSAKPCAACHDADYRRTAIGSIDHRTVGFSRDCASCHGALSFQGAAFPAHEKCFQIGAGEHAGIRCAECHTTVSGVANGKCETFTAACTACHAHSCAREDSRHKDRQGYQCKDRKCYECHNFTPK